MNFVMYQSGQAIDQSLSESNRVWQDDQHQFVLVEGPTVPFKLKTELNLKTIEFEDFQWLELFRIFSEEGLIRDVKFDSDVVTSRTHTFAYHMTYKKPDELLKALHKLMFVQSYAIEALFLKMSEPNGVINFELTSNGELKVSFPASIKNDPSYDMSSVYKTAFHIFEEVAKVLSGSPVEFKELQSIK